MEYPVSAGPHLLTARDGAQALCGGPGICPACEYDKRIAAAVKMYETLETIANFAPGNGDVCEIIARRARAALTIWEQATA